MRCNCFPLQEFEGKFHCCKLFVWCFSWFQFQHWLLGFVISRRSCGGLLDWVGLKGKGFCMGEQEEWAQPQSGLLPNGLLPNEAASVIQVLDSERWSKAEQRTAELIACIQPNSPSEQRRNAVAEYVQKLITKCFPCQVSVMWCWWLWIISCLRTFD